MLPGLTGTVDKGDSSGNDPGGWGRSSARAGGPASIRLCRVTAVWPDTYLLDVDEVFGSRGHEAIPFAALYARDDSRGGVCVMPEVGSHCYAVICADGTKFVLGFFVNPTPAGPPKMNESGILDARTTDDDPSCRGQRDSLEPGDIFLGTQDGNKIIVRAGGMIQISATGLAQRVYIPVENVIRDYFQRYQAYSPVGEIEWGHAILATGEDVSGGTGRVATSDYGLSSSSAEMLKTVQETPVMVKYNIKDLAQEDVSQGRFSVEVRVGRLTADTLDMESDEEHVFAAGLSHTPAHAGQGSAGVHAEERGIISITVYSHDEKDLDGVEIGPGQRVRYSFQLNRDGDNFVFTRGHMHIEVGRTIYVDALQGAKLAVGDTHVELSGTGDLLTEVRRIVHSVVEEVLVRVSDGAGVIDLTANTVKLGSGGGYQGVVRFDELQRYLATAVIVTPVGAGRIATPLPATVASSKVKASS
jgi:hypothetical protein